MEKKTKKKIERLMKTVVSLIATVLGLGTIGIFINVELHKINENKISVENNNGIIIGENNGVVKNYTMGGGTTKTRETDSKSKNNTVEYEPTYINDKNIVIKGEDLMLEGIVVNNYSNQIQDKLFETVFGNDRFSITFGVDHPVGYKLIAFNDKGGYHLDIDTTVCTTTIIDEWDNIQEGAIIQISPYDFDADGVNELIICITNGVEGICSVFSYTHVEDITKINPFRQELCVPIQENVYLDGNSLQIIIGSHGIIDKEYKYVDEQFMVVTQ